MTTSIVPQSGNGALFVQQGPGTTPGYSALDDRRSNSGSLQEGVLNASDFMVVQRNAGANMSVDIGVPIGGFAYVQGDTINGQGLYCVPVHSATINETITAADATNPRVDQIILEIQDNVLDASGNNLARTRVVAGTPSSGANLTNRTGAAALPGSALLLADVLVGNGVSSIGNAVIRDRRKWARGAFVRILRNSANYTTTAASPALVDSVNLQPRIESSGVPLKLTMEGMAGHSVDTDWTGFVPFVDGARVTDSTGNTHQFSVSGAGGTNQVCLEWTFLPTPGSHLIGWAWFTQAATATLYANGVNPLSVTVEEVVRQNTANNTTTTG